MESLRGSDPMMNPPPEKNKEGLTFEEWHTATGQAGSSEKLVEAWKNGEDPTEYHVNLTTKHTPLGLSPEERASLIALMATRTKLNSVRSQIYTKREELEVLEKQRNELTVELATHLRELVSGFTPYTPQSEEH